MLLLQLPEEINHSKVIILLLQQSIGEHVAVINLQDKFAKFSEHWTPKVIAEMNDYQFKLVKIEGEFVWHNHSDTDEVFIVVEGKMKIEFEHETIELNQGEMYVVPKGVQHKPYAEQECKVMLVELKGTKNTGSEIHKLTAEDNQWI